MRRRLILLLGGRSTEHDASLHSYRRVVAELLGASERFTVEAVVYLSRTGAAHAHCAPPWPTDEADLRAAPESGLPALLDLLARRGAFVLSLLHGNEGEDGAWQGLAEVLDLHGSFGGVLPSALGMNKRLQGLIAAALVPGMRLPDTWLARPPDVRDRVAQAAAALADRAAVVKPNRMGASLLTVRLPEPTPAALLAAVEDVLPYDEALIQAYIAGRELTCGVMRDQDGTRALPVIEARTAADFLGHVEKHAAGRVEAILHKNDDAATRAVKEASVRLFDELDLLGFARFDYIERDGEVFFLEVNTLPGLMEGSAFPRMLAAAGYSIADLIELCIADAERVPRREKSLPYAIEA